MLSAPPNILIVIVLMMRYSILHNCGEYLPSIPLSDRKPKNEKVKRCCARDGPHLTEWDAPAIGNRNADSSRACEGRESLEAAGRDMMGRGRINGTKVRIEEVVEYQLLRCCVC